MKQRTGQSEASRRQFIRRTLAGGLGVSSGLGATEQGATAQTTNPIRSFDHVSIPLRDTDAMLSFYRSLGFTIIEGPTICAAAVGDSKLNMHRPECWESGTFTLRAPAAEPPCGDYCFVWGESEEALDALLARVRAEIIEGPAPRVGGRALGTAEGTSRYIRDPDGNLLEFIVY